MSSLSPEVRPKLPPCQNVVLRESNLSTEYCHGVRISYEGGEWQGGQTLIEF